MTVTFSMCRLLRRSAFLLIVTLSALPAMARRVIFIDNRQAAGNGTNENPFPTLNQAEAVSALGDILYLAEGNRPYDENVALKPGQMLIGAAYGLDAARVDLHADFTGPSVPAVQGPGPTIHGSIWLPGDNVVAGCTLTVDSGVGIGASSPQGPLQIRKVFVRPSKVGSGIYIQNPTAQVTIEGGGVESIEQGLALGIDGGTGNVTVDHFPIAGIFSTAVLVRNRTGGAVTFRNGSRINVGDATRDAVVIAGCGGGSVTFTDPIHVVTHGGRGVVVASSHRVVFSAGDNRVDTINAAAIDLRDSSVDASFISISADRAAPGRLLEGLVISHVNGRVVVSGDEGKPASGGIIRNAEAYGIRVEQSANVRIGNMTIDDSGKAAAPCPEDVEKATNVRCSAALFLRHVGGSTFQNITITGGETVGINANNLSGSTFEEVHLTGTGAHPTAPGLLLQETIGTVTLRRCSIVDASGGAAVIEQRFNEGRIAFDQTTFAAPHRMTASPALLHIRSDGAARLAVTFDGGQIVDSAGSAIVAESRDTSSLALTFTQTWLQRLGTPALDMRVGARSRGLLAMHGSNVSVPGGGDRPAIDLRADGAACADLGGNTIVPGVGGTGIRLTAESRGSVHVVAAAAAAGDAPRDFLSRANGGVPVTISGPVSVVPACP